MQVKIKICQAFWFSRIQIREHLPKKSFKHSTTDAYCFNFILILL